ncbi:FAT domain protein [Theileria parva strain Muguga]|uniref:FAT domain protein n=1 Tax=Theileria parva strain Muguga TaxID=333668 RepID=UPI001C61CD57|nr:FAT domain protein [Theileria parva strain Muguga]EAN32018.2 FAT domain protein [Theileria parva strain Muguga]
MDPNLDSTNSYFNRGAYSPVISNSNPKDGHTPSDNELSKDCLNGVKKLIESFENYTVDGFLASFRVNYAFLKTLLLKNTNDPSLLELKTQCFDIMESFTKVEFADVQLRREFVSLCFNTIITSSNWDESCQRILKHFLMDPKHYVNLVQVDQFFEFATKLLSNYPNIQDKDVKRLLIFISLLDQLFTSPLFTKNLVQLLPVFRKVNGLNSTDHHKGCYFELILLSCRALQIFTVNLKQTFNYSTNLLNAFVILVNSGVTYIVLKSILQQDFFNKLYHLSLMEYSCTCSVLMLYLDVIKKLDTEHFNMQMFEKCNTLLSRHWLSSDYKIKELCLNLVHSLLCQFPKLSSNIDEESLNAIYKFSIITFFNAVNLISDLYYSRNKQSNAYLLYVKTVLNVLIEIIVVNYKLLIQLTNIKRVITINILQAFLITVKLSSQLYISAPGNKTIRMDEDEDEEKSEFLVILDNSVKLLCKTLEPAMVENTIRLVLPILVYYYLYPNRKLFMNEEELLKETQINSVTDLSETENQDQSKEERNQLENVILYLFFTFSKNYPDLFIQQYLSLVIQLMNDEDLDRLYRYSYNIIFQENHVLPPKDELDQDRTKIMNKLMNENIFVGLKLNLDSIKYITYDLGQMVNLVCNYYPCTEGSESAQPGDKTKEKMELYLRLLTVIFEKINSNPNYTYAYDQINVLYSFLNKILFYLELSDYRNFDLLSEIASSSYIGIEENEDLYAFVIVVSMNNFNFEYMRQMLRLVNYFINYTTSRKLLKYTLMLIENYVENTDNAGLYVLMADTIKDINPYEYQPIDYDEQNFDDKVEPYFIKFLMEHLLNDEDPEITKLVMNILGKLGSISQKYRVDYNIKNAEEFSLAFPCLTENDSTVVSIPVEPGLDLIIKRVERNLYREKGPLNMDEYNTYAGYLLIIMSPILQYNLSLTHFYIDATSKNQVPVYNQYSSNGTHLNREAKLTKTDDQMKYLRKLLKCLCLMLNAGRRIKKSVEYENLQLFRCALFNYLVLSSRVRNRTRDDNLSQVLYLLLLNVEYPMVSNESKEVEWDDSCNELISELFECIVAHDMDDVIEYVVGILVVKLNNHNIFRRVAYFGLLLKLFKANHIKYFKAYITYIYNMLLCTVVDLHQSNEELLINKANRIPEKILFTLIKLIVSCDPDFHFNNLTSMLNNKILKLRLLAMELLSEYKPQKLTQFFNTNFKSLQFLEILLLTTQYTHNKMCLDSCLKKLLDRINNYDEDSVEMMIYLRIVELLLFDSRFEKLFKQLDPGLIHMISTTLLNLVMISNGIMFKTSLSILKRLDKTMVTQNALMTLEPFIIQLQTIFNYSTVKLISKTIELTVLQKLMLLYEFYGSDFKCMKDSLYNVGITLTESKINVSELKFLSYIDFFKFLVKLGYNNKLFTDNQGSESTISSPIQVMQMYKDFINNAKLQDKPGENKAMESLTMYDLLYLMDDNSIKNTFNKLNNELNNNNNLNVIYQILCFIEYLSSVKSLVISTKEFKNVIKTVVTLSNKDIFIGHYLHPENRIFDSEHQEKDIDELSYISISNKCYELLHLHYPSTIDILAQYKFTPYSFVNATNELSVFNRFISDNFELMNNLKLFKSTSNYLYNTQLMVLLRIVHFINNNEDLVKGNLLSELLDYVCNGVLNNGSENMNSTSTKDNLNLDQVLTTWVGYYVVSKVFHLCNINYMLVLTVFRQYIEFVKSYDFTHLLNNLQSMPIEIFLILNNTFPLTVDEEQNAIDTDEFNNYFLVMKMVSFNFFNCLCNITILDNKKYQPVLLYLFNLSMPKFGPDQEQSSENSENGVMELDSLLENRTTEDVEKEDIRALTMLLGGFMNYFNNYRDFMDPYFVRFVDYIYKHTCHGYYYSRYIMEIVVGIILIYESNEMKYSKYKLMAVYFRIINSLRAHLTRTDYLKDSKLTNNIIYRYNGILSKTYKNKIFDNLSYDTNKLMFKSVSIKLLINDYPHLYHLIMQLNSIPCLMTPANLKCLLKSEYGDEQHEFSDTTAKFLDVLMKLIFNYLKEVVNLTPNPLMISTGSGEPDDPELNRLTELLNVICLYVDVLKVVSTKRLRGYINDYLPSFIKKLYVCLINVPHGKFRKIISANYAIFLELCFLKIYKFNTEVVSSFYKVVEISTKADKFMMFNILLSLKYFQPYININKRVLTRLRSYGSIWESPEEEYREDMDYNFFDYNGSYTEVSSESLEKYVAEDLTTPNRKFHKITFNHIEFAFNYSPDPNLVQRDLINCIRAPLDNYKFEYICNVLYYTRHISYVPEDCKVDEETLATEFNLLYLGITDHEKFKNLRLDIKMSYLTHCAYLFKSQHNDYVKHYQRQENLSKTIDLLFKYNQNATTLVDILFTLFRQDVEVGIGSNYPRLEPLDNRVGSGSLSNTDLVSQISFVCNCENSSLRPIVTLLKEFRNMSLDTDEDIPVSEPEDLQEFELSLDGKLYESLVKIHEYNKVYLQSYVNQNLVLKYLEKMCELDTKFNRDTFSKVFSQLYINLSEPHRNQVSQHVINFLTKKITSISLNHNLLSNMYIQNPTHMDIFCDKEDLDSINIVYHTVMNTYPMISLPVEMLKYLSQFLPGNYFNTCFYLENLMLAQPMDMTKPATLLSELYLRLDMLDLSIGTNRCWVITNETRLALANLQHGKWKQAQRDFNHIMDQLSNTGQTSETVAWFDESKLWFNYWMYCTKQLNEWDIIRDISYISTSKTTFSQSNVFLNSFPHMLVLYQNQNKDNYLLVNQESFNDVDSYDMEIVIEMNIYNMFNKINKAYSNNINTLYRQYNKEYYKLNIMTQNCFSWLLHYYKTLGLKIDGHVNCMRLNHRLTEISEGISYLKRSITNIYKAQECDEIHLINKWRNRLPNKYDHPSIWNTLLCFRTQVFSTVKNLTNLTNNHQPLNDSLLINQDYIWTLVKYSGVIRKSHQLPLIASVLLNKAQKYLVQTISKSPNIGEDYYLLINERLKQYLTFSINVPDALKSVITLDFDKLPNRGYETLKSHVTRLKAEAINRNYIYDIHHNQTNPNKRQLNGIGDIDLACKYMLEALKLQPLLSKNWISWAKFNDNKIDHSMVPMWAKNEQMFPLELYETSIMGYLTAISINPNCHWLLIKRLFTLLTEMHRGVNATSETFKKYSEFVHHCVWLMWLPQLVTFLYTRNNVEIFHLLKLLITKVPQQLYYTIRTEYLSLMPQNTNNGYSTRDEEEHIGRQNVNDIKNILQMLINCNPGLNHTLENFCNILTNMGKPDLIDEIMCAYETIFEECLELPFHEYIPRPMLYCLTNKILNKISSSISTSEDEDDDKELYSIVYNFTQNFIEPIKATELLNSVTSSSGFTPDRLGNYQSDTPQDPSEKGLTCGYTMNKLLDIISLLINFGKTRNKRGGRRDISHLLNYSVCVLSNKFTSSSNISIQLPHVVVTPVDDMIKGKNVIGEMHDILYVDPCLVKVRRRNHLVKCIKIITTDGQKHYYSVYPLVRARQKGEECIHKMSQLVNFYMKKYNETRRRNLFISSGSIVPLDPHICLVEDSPNSHTLLSIFNRSISMDNLLVDSIPLMPSDIRTDSDLNKLDTRLASGNGYETCLLLPVLHKILLEKNITIKLYECYNKYNPTSSLTNASTNEEMDKESGFNYIFKLFREKQYPWFYTWYRKIHQDLLQDSYNKLCNIVPDNILYEFVLESSVDYENFMNFRINFTSSYATQALLNLVFATPYSTPSKLVLNMNNGSIRQFDFKLFNREMDDNKIRVFRLTRNMTNFMGPTCRLGLLPGVMFAVSSSIHHFKIDVHAALSAILIGRSTSRDFYAFQKDKENLQKEKNSFPTDKNNFPRDKNTFIKDKDPKLEKSDEIDEYLSKILNYCSHLRSPADQEHSTLPINNVITCIIDASTDSSMIGKLKSCHQPWF